MKGEQNIRTDNQMVLAQLEEQRCPHCGDGTLERETYKGNRAVVCTTCETPQVQLW